HHTYRHRCAASELAGQRIDLNDALATSQATLTGCVLVEAGAKYDKAIAATNDIKCHFVGDSARSAQVEGVFVEQAFAARRGGDWCLDSAGEAQDRFLGIRITDSAAGKNDRQA